MTILLSKGMIFLIDDIIIHLINFYQQQIVYLFISGRYSRKKEYLELSKQVKIRESIEIIGQKCLINRDISIINEANFMNESKIQTSRIISSNLAQSRSYVNGFPLKIKMFVGLLLSLSQYQINFQISKSVKQNYESFSNIFLKLQKHEKQAFIQQVINHVINLMNRSAKKELVMNDILTSCQVRMFFVGLSYWDKRTFQLESSKDTLRLFNSKKQETIDLTNYLIRKSYSEKNSIVLQSIVHNQEKIGKITIRFKAQSIFRQIYHNINSHIIEITKKKLESMVFDEQKSSQSVFKSEKVLSKDFNILTSKSITEYFKVKEKAYQNFANTRVKASIVYNKNDIKIFQYSDDDRTYFVQYLIHSKQSFVDIKNKIPFLLTHKQQSAIYCEKLQTFAQSISANYYKFFVGKEELQWVVIQEKAEKNESISINLKTATNFYKKVSIQFLTLTFKKHIDDYFYLQISSIVHSSSKNPLRIRNHIVKILLKLIQTPNHTIQKIHLSQKSCVILDKKQSNQHQVNEIDTNKQRQNHKFNKFAKKDGQGQLKQQFYTILPSDYRKQRKNKEKQSPNSNKSSEKEEQDSLQQQFYTIQSNDSIEQRENQKLKQYFQELQQPKSRKQSDWKQTLINEENHHHFLNIKHRLSPSKQQQFTYVKEHFLLKQFKLGSKGGVVLCDQQLLNQQKQILKLVVTRLGNNIFKRQSIMNMSLPIQIFSNQSLLSCIAKNFSYAPIFLKDVSSDHTQRLKKVCLIQITMAALAIDAKKPFNPILGQTYQGFIDGCPISFEQVSHHPPISYLYFVGRGYKIYGPISIQISLRLNYVKGISLKYLTIEFDDGEKMQFDIPTMVLNNLIIGERNTYFEGQNYVVDVKNQLISEIVFNSTHNKKSLIQKKGCDYFYGQIFKVTPVFLKKFITQKKISPKKQAGNKVISTIQGEWHGKIYINDQLITDISHDLPLRLVNYEYSLPSDSTLRYDLKILNDGDVNAAQVEKDKMQDIQRKDKKLRLLHKAK